MMILGLDIGSVIAKAVLLDEQTEIRDCWETKSRGRPADAARILLEQFPGNIRAADLKIGLTGYGREGLSYPTAVYACNEIVAWTVPGRGPQLHRHHSKG